MNQYQEKFVQIFGGEWEIFIFVQIQPNYLTNQTKYVFLQWIRSPTLFKTELQYSRI